MQFGIAVSTAADSWKTVARAEDVGYRRAWFYDTQMISADPFIAMGVAAVTANSLATLNALAPGRIDFGIGTGFSARRAMGLGAVKLADMADYTETVMGLLRGETVEAEVEGRRRKLRLLNPDAGLINLKDPVGLYVSAMGPRARTLTAKLGAGWITLLRAAEGAQQQRDEMQAAWKAAGLAAGSLDTVAFGYGAILRPGERADSPRVIAEVGAWAASLLRRAADEALLGLANLTPAPEWVQAAVAEYTAAIKRSEPADARYMNNYRGHLVYLRPDERRFITDQLIRYTSFTGTEDEVIGWMQTLRAAGYSEFTVCVLPGQEQVLEDWARVMRAVG